MSRNDTTTRVTFAHICTCNKAAAAAAGLAVAISALACAVAAYVAGQQADKTNQESAKTQPLLVNSEKLFYTAEIFCRLPARFAARQMTFVRTTLLAKVQCVTSFFAK